MTDKRHFVLIGMPGSGKTTLGQALAEQSGRAFLDTDTLVEQRYGMSVAEVFTAHGEAYFRTLETEAARHAAHTTEPAVIATGGGLVLNPENPEILKETGLLVYLKCSADCLAMRLAADRDDDPAKRPLLAGADLEAKIRALLKERSRRYLKYADVVLDGDLPVATLLARMKGN